MEKLEEDLKILNKNNLLIKANYNLSFVENKFYLTILFNMQKTSRGNYIGIIPREEFIRLSNKTTNKTSVGIGRILESLSNKRVQIQEFKKQNRKPSEYDFPIITGYAFNPDDDTYTIELSTILYDLLIKYMDVGYTPLNLGILLGLNNFYAQRLYELLRLWSSSREEIVYKVDYLRECFNLENKYSKYTDFRKRVIDSALEALNNTEKFKIGYKEIKVGRNIDSIKFKVKDLDKRKYFNNKKELNVQKDVDMLPKVKEAQNKVEKIEIKDFYVPNKKLFTARTLEMFKNDFVNYDFKDDKYKKLLQESILIALDKDDEEKIKVKTYNYFKKILENKIESSKIKPRRVKKTSFHNINQSFSNYDENELEKILKESQKNKFK